MSKHNRSICDPAKPCVCGGRGCAIGGMPAHVECNRCGRCTEFHPTSEEACDAWDRGEVMTEEVFLARARELIGDEEE
ncbi:hypothetical protein C3942_00675 [Solimonas fluminis]|uniref:Uncharacterized protein n=1 Tax=Solimonas fluminis TaxID=2086571 RepID=A0A2S5TKH6_9GAMM|nr:hypothetical protein [Solimonas fluminis]PPE75442.1 hypothetical protein C3942_00675 [Solimonas fluminis]